MCGSRAVGVVRATPGVHDVDAGVLEIVDIAGREGATGARDDRCDLGVGDTDGASGGGAGRDDGSLAERSRRGERQDAAIESVERAVERSPEASSTVPDRQ